MPRAAIIAALLSGIFAAAVVWLTDLETASKAYLTAANITLVVFCVVDLYAAWRKRRAERESAITARVRVGRGNPPVPGVGCMRCIPPKQRARRCGKLIDNAPKA